MRTISKFFAVILILLVGCAVQPPIPPYPLPKSVLFKKVSDKNVPYVRIGIIWGKSQITFSADRDFKVVEADGKVIARGRRNRKWQVSVEGGSDSELVCRLVAGSFKNVDGAKARASLLSREGYPAEVRPNGNQIHVNGIMVDNQTWRVYLKKLFWSRQEAEAYRDAIRDRHETFIVEEPLSQKRSAWVLRDLTGRKEWPLSKAIFIDGAAVTLYQVDVGNGFHWERTETRKYPEIISFDLDRNGRAAAVNILSMEDYLKGVVPSEMSDTFPIEALKAQAIAARSEALAKFSKRHQGQPFDLCADVHCQVYSGLSNQSARTNKAVNETRGKVLWQNGEICDAVYSATCGGHTEHNDKAWGGNPVDYLRGNYDGSNHIRRFGSLTRDKNVTRWIDDYPREAYCNTTYGRIPNCLNYTKKYFRWEVPYTQAELRGILERTQNRTVGPILDLIPLSRGVSGRVIRLKVSGGNGEYVIDGELRIRKALSENTLWSSCIYIQKYGYGTVPSEFVIKGAGFGHGVGMCQTGAAIMALRGKKYERILRHYFQGVKIRKIY